MGNIGITYYSQGRLDEAIPLLEEDINYGLENNRTADNATKSLAILADIYYQKGQVDKALDLLNKADSVIRREKLWTRYEILEFVYPVLAKVYAAKGNKDKAYAFMDSAMKVKDSLNSQKNGLILLGAQSTVTAQQHVSEMQHLNDQKKLQVSIRNGLMASIILLCVVAVLFINRQKIRHKRREERIEAEKYKIEAELMNAGIQLNAFTQSVHDKNELIEKFTAQLENLQVQNKTADDEERNKVLFQLQQVTILTDEEWKNFKIMFEKVHGGYLNRLIEKFPDLSPADIRYMTLTRLNLSTKEIAGVLGITTNAVRMHRSRLQKKLGLEDTSIEDLVIAI